MNLLYILLRWVKGIVISYWFQVAGYKSWTELKLPFTPRIGDEIDLDFLDHKYFKRGYVHSVEHRIDGVKQEIYIEVHPLHNEYYRWREFEEEYERREKWK
jgi:hypothetical protein